MSQSAEIDPLGEHFIALAGDVLPDGRVDHRGHQKDDQGGYGWVCADCSGEDEPGWIDWTIPYDTVGRPIPEDWRTMPYATVLALCGMTRPVPSGKPVRCCPGGPVAGHRAWCASEEARALREAGARPIPPEVGQP